MEIKQLLEALNSKKASDLILVAGYPPSLRINNSLEYQGEKNLTPEIISGMLAVIINEEKMREFEKHKELDIAYEDALSRYRINLHYQKGGIAAAIRRVSKEIPSLEELGLPPVVKSFTAFERGMVLVTGPTGSGKSTTQAAMIDLINSTRACHVITIEDPIEYVHDKKRAVVEQREVGFDTGSFDEALRRVLRQIPDVIFIGEMRDLESIRMALTAAETGHLVISTLHTQDAVQTVDRIVDVFPPYQQEQIRSMFSMTLQAIVSQRLIPHRDESGLALATEIMVATPAVRNLIRKGSTHEISSMIELGSKLGMQTMEASLNGLVIKGAISKEDALAYAVNRERMAKMLGIK